MTSESISGESVDPFCSIGTKQNLLLLEIHIEMKGCPVETVEAAWTPEETWCIMTKSQFEQLGSKAKMTLGHEVHDNGSSAHKCIGTFIHSIWYKGEHGMRDVCFCIVDDSFKPPILLAGQAFRPGEEEEFSHSPTGKTEPASEVIGMQPITTTPESKENQEKRTARMILAESDTAADVEAYKIGRKKRQDEDQDKDRSKTASSITSTRSSK